MKYYVVSDIHSYFSYMKKALSDAGFFDDSDPHKLVVLGDLFDRGTESQEMQSFVCDLIDRDEIILIRGNHEDLFEELVTIDEGKPYSHHVSNGTYDTALQLTEMNRDYALYHSLEFAEAAQKTPFYQKIMPSMVDYFETPNYVFVHGWIPCFRQIGHFDAISDWRNVDANFWADARWINGMKASKSVQDDKTIVCGHWHASYGHSVLDGNGPEFGEGAIFTPYYGNGIIAIDACTACSGFVNCVVIED